MLNTSLPVLAFTTSHYNEYKSLSPFSTSALNLPPSPVFYPKHSSTILLPSSHKIPWPLGKVLLFRKTLCGPATRLSSSGPFFSYLPNCMSNHRHLHNSYCVHTLLLHAFENPVLGHSLRKLDSSFSHPVSESSSTS